MVLSQLGDIDVKGLLEEGFKLSHGLAKFKPFFDELREKATKLPNGNPLPELFDFTKEEISSTSPEIIE